MSNPAVIKLQEKVIDGKQVWLDDNIGEAIHLHIDDMRVDLTCKEFEKLCFDLEEAVNELINIKGFDCHNIDPVYLEAFLSKNLSNLKKIKKDRVFLEDLYAPGKNGISPLKKSRAVKALHGDTRENDGYRASHHIGQTSQQRLESMLQSVKIYGYPYNNQYIILYGDDNIIRDGQHRAACLYYLKGNIEIPVLRFYFEGYKKESIVLSRSKLLKFLRKVRNYISRIQNVNDLKRGVKFCLRPFLNLVEQYKLNSLIKGSKGKYEEAVKIMGNR